MDSHVPTSDPLLSAEQAARVRIVHSATAGRSLVAVAAQTPAGALVHTETPLVAASSSRKLQVHCPPQCYSVVKAVALLLSTLSSLASSLLLFVVAVCILWWRRRRVVVVSSLYCPTRTGRKRRHLSEGD
jgi:hypothetical protein